MGETAPCNERALRVWGYLQSTQAEKYTGMLGLGSQWNWKNVSDAKLLHVAK